MEKYSKHLESIVAERTQEMFAEKEKADKLLYSECVAATGRLLLVQVVAATGCLLLVQVVTWNGSMKSVMHAGSVSKVFFL